MITFCSFRRLVIQCWQDFVVTASLSRSTFTWIISCVLRGCCNWSILQQTNEWSVTYSANRRAKYDRPSHVTHPHFIMEIHIPSRCKRLVVDRSQNDGVKGLPNGCVPWTPTYGVVHRTMFLMPVCNGACRSQSLLCRSWMLFSSFGTRLGPGRSQAPRGGLQPQL